MFLRVCNPLVNPGRLRHPPLNLSQPQFPPSATVYDYFVDPKKLDWEPWEPKVPPFRYLKTMPFHKMIVPTVDTVRTLYFDVIWSTHIVP